MILIRCHGKRHFLLVVSFEELCQLRMLSLWHLLEESLCSMDIIGKDGSLEINQSYLELI